MLDRADLFYYRVCTNCGQGAEKVDKLQTRVGKFRQIVQLAVM